MDIIPLELMNYFEQKYGTDYYITVSRNPYCENWKTSLKDKYIFDLEQVKLLIMTHNKNGAKEKKIGILKANGKELD